jgi:FkbH-like protein
MIKIAILGTYATQFFNRALKKSFRSSEFDISIYESDYNTIDYEVINLDSNLYKFCPDFIIMHESDISFRNEFYSIEDDLKSIFYLEKKNTLTNRINLLSQYLPNTKILYPSLLLKNDNVYGNFYSKTKFSWFFQANLYNTSILENSIESPNFFVIDSFSNLPSNIILRNSFLVNSADLHFTIDYLEILSDIIKKQIVAFKGIISKCLILDLDNTLWGGIIGDDGLNGIQIGDNGIGKAHLSLQKWIKQLKNRGIILAICSKNEISIAQQPFISHPNMALKLDDIAVFIANWNSKADNINHIKEILNIGYDSMVFLDDNPAEREIVKKFLPDIIVPDLPDDVSEYLPYLTSLNLFETTSVSESDKLRTKQYQEESQRAQFSKSVTNMVDFLISLEMSAHINSFQESEYDRLAQLSQRSNQFNLRTIRYSFQDIMHISTSNEYLTFSVSMKDKFGDYGLISMVVVKIIDKNIAFIETWIMSCRVLKRTVENLVMNQIVIKLRELKIDLLLGEYLQTNKNILVKNLLPNFGFAFKESNSENKFEYKLELNNYKHQKTNINHESRD